MVPEITVRHCSSTSVDLRYSSASKKSYPFLQSNAVIIPSFKPTQNIWTTRHFCCDHLSIKGFRDSSVYCTAGSSLQPFSQANLALILRMDLWRNLWAVSARARTQTMLPTCRLIKLPFSLWFIGQCTPGFERRSFWTTDVGHGGQRGQEEMAARFTRPNPLQILHPTYSIDQTLSFCVINIIPAMTNNIVCDIIFWRLEYIHILSWCGYILLLCMLLVKYAGDSFRIFGG
jgi:hypothetical protein